MDEKENLVRLSRPVANHNSTYHLTPDTNLKKEKGENQKVQPKDEQGNFIESEGRKECFKGENDEKG
jgi:hypothetical protein